jgi:hypothetical protein
MHSQRIAGSTKYAFQSALSPVSLFVFSGRGSFVAIVCEPRLANDPSGQILHLSALRSQRLLQRGVKTADQTFDIPVTRWWARATDQGRETGGNVQDLAGARDRPRAQASVHDDEADGGTQERAAANGGRREWRRLTRRG